MVGRIYKEDYYTLLHTKYESFGLVVSEKKIFLCFPHDAPGTGPVWTPGVWLAGFIKRTTLHCYTQNMKALGVVVSEFFLCFSHCKSMEDNDPRGGSIFDPRGMVGRIYKEDHYTLLHTKYESSGPCGFGGDFLCFSMTPPGRGMYGPRGTVDMIYKEDHYKLLHIKYESSHCKYMGVSCCHGN